LIWRSCDNGILRVRAHPAWPDVVFTFFIQKYSESFSMLLTQRSTLTQFLIEERRRFPGAGGDFNALILDIALACKAIARTVAFGELGGVTGDHASEQGGSVNVQGETQKKLDVLSNDVFIRRTEWSGHLAGMASEEMDLPYQIPGQYPRG
jgi:fructose-1,6-bisphosphatase I/sedoheptulose-1,7-bisphosphatase